jgi:hypothetical protein
VLVAGASALLAAGAGAQAAPHRASAQLLPTVTVTAPREDDDPFALDDALLDGVALSDAQREDVVQLRRLQLVEQESSREQFLDAVDVMRRAHDRGDDGTAGTIMAVLQSEMKSQQTWRLAALRALLTPEQRRLFDANVDAVTSPRSPAQER